MTPPRLVALSRSKCLFQKSQRSRIPSRHTSTSTTSSNIPPESPKFIDVPQPPQPQARPKPAIKGVLPVPRSIFPFGGVDKTTPEYLDAIAPERATTKDYASLPPDVRELMGWKTRQSETRRRNLREGLTELHQRKKRVDKQMTSRSLWKQAEHERKVHAPEREDERLTSPSVLQAMKEHSRFLPDPNRADRIAMKMARVRTREAEKVEERRSSLHTLYMNARDFIVTEADLNAKVDEVFDDEWFKVNEGFSIWDKEGYPDGVRDMLNAVNKTDSRSAVQHHSGHSQITRERLQRIAEELTGGKM